MGTTGRLSSSLVNDVAKTQPVSFRKEGTVSAAALSGRYYNNINVALQVTKVVASAVTAPTGAALVVDVKKNGTSVFAASGDRTSIAASTNRGEAEPTKTGDDVLVKPGEYLTVEVTQVGSTVAGADLHVQIFLG
jgi:hypothetical protein